ncbi:ABC transporter permease [Pimelobacter simplex]|uniref:ABC transporter permease n=1 Tax=Nocardioides simplex TaxID=2045 RepID=UPI0019326982|nr:ABC transporter permease [Pimelobacter simplex]
MSDLAAPQLTLDVSSTPRVPFGRLVLVEWRKMLDTRAGRWLLGITAGLLALLSAVIMLVVALADISPPTANDWLNIMTIPVSMLVPVMAITIVTQEWSQRTAMVTFALEASRLRVVLAKLLAVMALGAATIVLALVLGLVGNVIGAGIAGVDAEWNVTASVFVWALATQVLYLLMGFGFGLLLLSSPAALALYYVYVWILEGGVLLPGIMYVLYFTMDWAQSILPWISMRLAMLPYQLSDADARSFESDLGFSFDTGALGLARVLTSVFIWVGLPLILGTWRLLRAEVK